jgi:hypothetical protein
VPELVVDRLAVLAEPEERGAEQAALVAKERLEAGRLGGARLGTGLGRQGVRDFFVFGVVVPVCQGVGERVPDEVLVDFMILQRFLQD